VIRVSNGYILTETPTVNKRIVDTVAAVSQPILAPKCELISNAQGGNILAYKTRNSGYSAVTNENVFSGNYEAAIFTGAEIVVDALHIAADSLGDFVCKFRWTADAATGYWLRDYSFDGGETWSEPTREISFSGNPENQQSYLWFSSGLSPSLHCLLYNGDYYNVAPYFGAQLMSDSVRNFSRASTSEYSNDFAAILQSEPIAHSDYIHTVSGVVT
jgi:hypothetical protein